MNKEFILYKENRKQQIKTILFKILIITIIIACITIPIGFYTYMIVTSIKFDKNCANYLKMSANAISVEIAEERLTTALAYLETHDMTSGDCKFWISNMPENNIGLWYGNLKEVQNQLRTIISDENTTELEKSNVLIKLKEVIYNGEDLVMPEGLCYFPHQSLILSISCFIWLLVVVGIITLLWFLLDYF